jgi:hypothetical protein
MGWGSRTGAGGPGFKRLRAMYIQVLTLRVIRRRNSTDVIVLL